MQIDAETIPSLWAEKNFSRGRINNENEVTFRSHYNWDLSDFLTPFVGVYNRLDQEGLVSATVESVRLRWEVNIKVRLGSRVAEILITLDDQYFQNKSAELDVAKVKEELLRAAGRADLELGEHDLLNFPKDLIALWQYELVLNIPETIEILQNDEIKNAVDAYKQVGEKIKNTGFIIDFVALTSKIREMIKSTISDSFGSRVNQLKIFPTFQLFRLSHLLVLGKLSYILH